MIAHRIDSIGTDVDEAFKHVCTLRRLVKKIERAFDVNIEKRVSIHAARWTEDIRGMDDGIYIGDEVCA